MSASEIEKNKSSLIAIAGKSGSTIGSTAVYAAVKATNAGPRKRAEVVNIFDKLYEFYDDNKIKEKESESESGNGDVETTGKVDISKEELVKMNVVKKGMEGAYDRAYEIAIKNVLQNNRDQIFYETAEIITNTGGGRVPSSALLQNLILFVYGDEKARVTQERINKTEKFQDIIFLTLITRKALLGNGMSQEDIFNQISHATGRSTIVHFNQFRKAKGCEMNTIPGKGFFSMSRKVYSCNPETWADIYSSFSEKQIKLAIGKIVFSNQVY